MKIISGMFGVLMLTLLPLPLEAKEVYFAVVSEEAAKGVQDYDGLDPSIQGDIHSIDKYFKNGDLTLSADQELIIRGGSGSIGVELDKYKHRRIILAATGSLKSYGCYVRRPFPRENTTYVMVRADSWHGEKLCQSELATQAAGNITKAILLDKLSTEAKPISKNAKKL